VGHHHCAHTGIDYRPETCSRGRSEIGQRGVRHHLAIVAVGQFALAREVLRRGGQTGPPEAFGEGGGARASLDGRDGECSVADGPTGRPAVGVDDWGEDQVESEVAKNATPFGRDGGYVR
jgi:hypothetical protein